MVRSRLPWLGSLTAACLGAAALLGGVLLAPSATASPATLTAAVSGEPACAWGTEVSASTDNVFYPDSSAAYWVLRYTVQDGLDIALSGRYADSRYTSFTVYKSGGGTFTTNGVNSALTDYQIAPDAGSVNPWQHPALPGGRFSVTLRSDPVPGQVNTLPLAPAGTASGTAGYLVYRVYLPAGGNFNQVPLPHVAFVQDGMTTPVPTCSRNTTTATDGLTSTTPAAGTGMQFARSSGASGVFPNTDSGYLNATVTPPGGDDVVVVHGKAPSHAPGSHPSPWPASGMDMRYWSMCVNLPDPQRPVVVNDLPNGTVDYGCRSDEQTVLDSSGDYTYVVGTEAQRAAIEAIPGVTFLPFSTTQPNVPHVLLLRNMLVGPGFTEAVQDAPRDDNPASAASAMGPYYPQDAICPLTTLEHGGVSACLGMS